MIAKQLAARPTTKNWYHNLSPFLLSATKTYTTLWKNKAHIMSINVVVDNSLGESINNFRPIGCRVAWSVVSTWMHQWTHALLPARCRIHVKRLLHASHHTLQLWLFTTCNQYKYSAYLNFLYLGEVLGWPVFCTDTVKLLSPKTLFVA